MKSYRVVETDNLGGDYPNEKFASPYTLSEKNAQALADLFNSFWCNDDYATRYWKVVEDGYELQPGFEP